MVLSPEVDDVGMTGVVDRVTQLITRHGGAVTNQENWGLRRLAYPIQKFREGSYILAEFASEPASTKELEAALTASGEVLRYLLVKKEN